MLVAGRTATGVNAADTERMLQEEGDVSGIDAMWAMQCNTVHEWLACYNIKNAEQGGQR